MEKLVPTLSEISRLIIGTWVNESLLYLYNRRWTRIWSPTPLRSSLGFCTLATGGRVTHHTYRKTSKSRGTSTAVWSQKPCKYRNYYPFIVVRRLLLCTGTGKYIKALNYQLNFSEKNYKSGLVDLDLGHLACWVIGKICSLMCVIVPSLKSKR